MEEWRSTSTHPSVVVSLYFHNACLQDIVAVKAVVPHPSSDIFTLVLDCTTTPGSNGNVLLNKPTKRGAVELSFPTVANHIVPPMQRAIAAGKDVHLLLLGCNMAHVLNACITEMSMLGSPLQAAETVAQARLHVCYTYDDFPGGAFPLVLAAYSDSSRERDLSGHQRRTRILFNQWFKEYEKTDACRHLKPGPGQRPWPERMMWRSYGLESRA